jgi:hypothetical protein
MQFEITITSHDLKVILIDVTGKPLLLTLKLRNSEELIEEVTIQNFDSLSGLITLIGFPGDSIIHEISYLEIECLEFQSFYKYKGEAAKNFYIE